MTGLHGAVSHITVVIPAFNPSGKKLARTIDSVIRQTYSDCQIIVIDDGSEKPLAGMERNYPQVDWVTLPENRGVAAARNAGAEVARGEYLAFLDVGDWWHEEKLARQVEAFEANPDAGLVFCATCTHRGDKVRRHPARQYDDFYRELLVRQCIAGSASSAMVRRTVFESAGGFYDKEDIPEDRDLWLRLAAEYPFVAVDEPLVHIEESPHSRSGDPVKKQETYMRFLRRYEQSIREAGLWGEAMCHYHLVIGLKYLQHQHWLRGMGLMARAALDSPGYIVQKIRQRMPGF